MKIIGKRRMRTISDTPDAQGLRDTAQQSETIGQLSGWRGMPKGIFRYKTHEQANRHQEACQLRFIVELALRREGK